jgi:hypothetical protein
VREGIEDAVAEVEQALKEATDLAKNQMRALPKGRRRAAYLKLWEETMNTKIRPAYKASAASLSQSQSLSKVQKEALKRRLDQVVKAMVVDRSYLEGLVDGKGPTPHNAGGFHPPPSQVPQNLMEKARSRLQAALQTFESEAGQAPPGELSVGWMYRCAYPLRRTLTRIKTELEKSGYEHREFFESLRLEVARFESAALARRDMSSDHRLAEIRQELMDQLRELLAQFRRAEDQSELLSRGRQLILEATGLLQNASIRASLEEETIFFERELSGRAGDLCGRWKTPPVFQPILSHSLGRWVKTGPRVSDGVYVSFHWNRSLKEAVALRDGQVFETLKVDKASPRARLENSASVMEFRADGMVEEFSGRYEREYRARRTFDEWVTDRVSDMVREWRRWEALHLKSPPLPPRPPEPPTTEEDYDDGDPYACMAAGAAGIEAKNPNYRYLVGQCVHGPAKQFQALVDKDLASVKVALWDLWSTSRGDGDHSKQREWAARQMALLGDASLVEYDQDVPPPPPRTNRSGCSRSCLLLPLFLLVLAWARWAASGEVSL